MYNKGHKDGPFFLYLFLISHKRTFEITMLIKIFKIVVPVFLIVFAIMGCHEDQIDVRQNVNLPDNFYSFEYLPTELDKMSEFAAIGQIYDWLPKAHGGFGLKKPYSSPDIPVYAMADGVIYNIRYGTDIYGDFRVPDSLKGKYYDDFALHIYLSKTAEMHYGHLSRLAPEILMEADNLVKNTTENDVAINIKAGQIIAYIGIHPGFDIGFNDEKNLPYFANPDRYHASYRSAIPFTDRLPQNLRDEIWKINPRTVEPLGGKINYDVEGSVSGNWFLEGTKSLEEPGKILLIAYHERYADRITIADGSPMLVGSGNQNPGNQPNLWWIIGNDPAPENITMSSGKVKLNVATWYKFRETDNNPPSEGTVMFEMIAVDKLKFEFFEGKLPHEIIDFSASVRIYER